MSNSRRDRGGYAYSSGGVGAPTPPTLLQLSAQMGRKYFPYHAGVHVHYQETKLQMKDGLPKLKDLPKEMGGSGVSVAE